MNIRTDIDWISLPICRPRAPTRHLPPHHRPPSFPRFPRSSALARHLYLQGDCSLAPL